MLNSCTILCILALASFIQSMPMDSNISTETEQQQEDSDDSINQLFPRELQDKIDGTTHHIKAAGVTYQQRIIDNQCFVEYDGRLLGENSVIKIRKKVFRVDNCLLERVYHACGPNLLLMLGVVCRVVEQHKISNTLVNLKREANVLPTYYFDPTAHRTKRVITESCCENLCSISELTRYCHE
jgi:hypothetical protein